MVFIDNAIIGDLPAEIDSHMARTWRVGIPFDKDIIAQDIEGLYVIQGSWFAGNIYKHEETTNGG